MVAADTPSPVDTQSAQELCDFIDASPSPFHVCETAAVMLEAGGFRRCDERNSLPGVGSHYVIRGGALVAWRAGEELSSFRLIGAHTDSPNLRVKPNPDVTRAGYQQLAVEVYGGPLLNSWLDRDLGLSGRVAVRGASGIEIRLLRIDEPLLRIPQLAIHLDREINEKGLLLNKQTHLSPFWALDSSATAFLDVISAAVASEPQDVLSWDVMVHPLEPSRIVGVRGEFVSAPRIDNQLSCWAGLSALLACPVRPGIAQVVVLFDHEEVGSTSERGADGAFLGSILERIATSCGLGRAEYLTAVANSFCVSADCAHATNPNYADRHEPSHQILLNGGPVLKVNTNLRYATDAASAAVFAEACRSAGVPCQRFVNRTDLACGSTIGPLTAAMLSMPTVDVGAPQLAMHSARELCGSVDPGYLLAALNAYLSDF